MKTRLHRLNKKAGEKYLSPWLYLNWIIIGVAVYIAVNLIYAHTINADPVHADILGRRIFDCIVDGGHIDNEFLAEDIKNIDILYKCGINKKALDSNFYFKIQLYDIDDTGKLQDNPRELDSGKRDLEMMCKLINNRVDIKNKFGCSYNNAFVVSDNGKRFLLKIFAAAGEEGK